MRKNVILISFDDAVNLPRYKTLFGPGLKTPNLDRIRAVSTTFHAAYCQAPLCGPSRASFMTGMSPHQTGILDNSTKAFAKLKPQDIWSYQLKRAGFYCSSGGKVHHGYTPLPAAIHAQLYSDQRKMFPRDLKRRPGVNSISAGGSGGGIWTLDPADDETYYDAYSARSFAEFIETYDSDTPFYREVGFFSPHSPYITPARFKQAYRAGEFQYPAEWSDELLEAGPLADAAEANFRTHKKRHWQKSVLNYFSAITHGDHHLGRVWDALQASRFRDETIVVILSDHGMHLGENKRFGKSTLLEQVANVPLVIHDPDHAKGRDIHDPVALADVGPTVLDMAGLPVPDGSVGRSLCGLMEGSETWADRTIPTLRAEDGSIRKGRYRFTCDHKSGKTMFHDIVDDWWQQKALGPDHPDHASLLSAYQAMCKEYGVSLA